MTEKTPEQLRAEAEALLKHADALERWGRERVVVPIAEPEALLTPDEALDEAIDAVWNQPNPNIVKLQDGRQVARKYYDEAIHGPAIE